MDNESWARGYLTGAALHRNLRAPQIRPVPIASMSVSGVAADLEWFADLSGVSAVTLLSAEYAGEVAASYGFDGKTYSDFAPLPKLLSKNPAALFRGLNPEAPFLYFRFRLADGADMSSFALSGVFAETGAAQS